ncbi:MAG: DUF2237 family protein, partial [Verrucomicrobiota bacterium]
MIIGTGVTEARAEEARHRIHTARDHGMHTVCAQMTEAFLRYSKEQGNDLST